MKKKLLIIIGIIFSVFVLFNVGWFTWRSIKYNVYSENMEKGEWYTIVIPRYVKTDNDGFDYLVKYPDYLTFSGNLSVGMPATDDNLFTDALLIWPLLGGDYKYGVLLYEEDDGYNIYIDAQGRALDSIDNEVIERHKSNIEILLEKAKDMWNIEK